GAQAAAGPDASEKVVRRRRAGRLDVETAGSELNRPHLAFGTHRAQWLSVQRNRNSAGVAEPEHDGASRFHGAALVRIQRARERKFSIYARQDPNRLFGGDLHT